MYLKKSIIKTLFQVRLPTALPSGDQATSLSIFDELEQSHIKAAKLIHNLPSETPDSDVLKL